MENINWLAQGIGALGVISFVISFQFKSNKTLLLCQALADLFFCIQFIVLKSYTGCIELLIVTIRNIIISYKKENKFCAWKGWLYVFIVLLSVSTIITWDGIKSVLPYIACVSATIVYYEDNARKNRTINLFVGGPCWLIYDLIVGSYAGSINEIISMVSVIVSIVRFGWNNLGDEKLLNRKENVEDGKDFNN